MKGYVIIDTEVLEPETYAEFLERAPTAIEANIGRFIVRTSEAEVFEDVWSPRRLVTVEIESLQAAEGLLGSSENSALSDVRHRAANSGSAIAYGRDF